MPRPRAASSRARRAASAARGRREIDLRPLALSDAEAFIAAVRASRRLHRPWVNPPATREAFARLVQRGRGEANRVALVALRKADGAPVGVLNLSMILRVPLQQAFLGYYAFVPHTRQGYMREAMQLLLRYAFRTLKLHRIEANIQPANAASIALARGAGFSREGFSPRYLKIGGRWCDHERWAINAEQWKAIRAAGGNHGRRD
jgi:ribosomal-protein-alanine N-acetyltransferase